MQFMKFLSCLLMLIATTGFAGEPEPGCHPFVAVYVRGRSIHEDNATISMTNPEGDAAILVTSMEFKNQMPTIRSFFSGEYGAIYKSGNEYHHNINAQVLSMVAVSTCFLLPGQSIAWKRPLRVMDNGYELTIRWMEIPRDTLRSKVYFLQNTEHTGNDRFQLLTPEKELIYRNMGAANGTTPKVVVEGKFPVYQKTIHADCHDSEGRMSWESNPPHEAALDIEKEYGVAPEVADFILLRDHSKERTIPFMFKPEDFGDLIQVKTPSQNMYYEPGITNVPMNILPKIMARARDKQINVTLKRINPNSLGCILVLIAGVNIDNLGRPAKQ